MAKTSLHTHSCRALTWR